MDNISMCSWLWKINKYIENYLIHGYLRHYRKDCFILVPEILHFLYPHSLWNRTHIPGWVWNHAGFFGGGIQWFPRLFSLFVRSFVHLSAQSSVCLFVCHILRGVIILLSPYTCCNVRFGELLFLVWAKFGRIFTCIHNFLRGEVLTHANPSFTVFYLFHLELCIKFWPLLETWKYAGFKW